MTEEDIKAAGFSIVNGDIEKARNKVRLAIGIFEKISSDNEKNKEDLAEAGKMLIYYFSKLSDMQLTYTNELILINKGLAEAIQGKPAPAN